MLQSVGYFVDDKPTDSRVYRSQQHNLRIAKKLKSAPTRCAFIRLDRFRCMCNLKRYVGQ